MKHGYLFTENKLIKATLDLITRIGIGSAGEVRNGRKVILTQYRVGFVKVLVFNA